MNRYPVVFLFALLVSATALSQTGDQQTDQQRRDESERQVHELHFVSTIKGWFVAEETLRDYEIGIDRQIRHGGEFSGHIKSISDRSAAGVIRQAIKSDHYRGRRVRLSGYVKSEIVEGWAGLWMRVDGEQGYRLSLDNMQNRPIKGTTEWTRYEIVLNVPENSIALAFGVLLAGKGQIWADDLRLEAVGQDTPTSEVYGKSQAYTSSEKDRIRDEYARRLLADLKTLPLELANADFEDKK